MNRKLVTTLSLGALALAACSDAPTSIGSAVAPFVAPPSKHVAGVDGPLTAHADMVPTITLPVDGSTVSAGEITLSWDAPPPAGGVQNYRYSLSCPEVGCSPIASTLRAATDPRSITVTLTPGTYTFSIRGEKTSGGQLHAPVYVTRQFTVGASDEEETGPFAQTITWQPLTSKTYGTMFDVSASVGASSTLPVTLTSLTPTICEIGPLDAPHIDAGFVRTMGVGKCQIKASQAGGTVGDKTYSAAADEIGEFQVTAAQLIINATNVTTTYGTAPTVAYSLSGFVYDETEAGLRSATPAALSGSASCSVAAGTPTDAGTYADVISCVASSLNATNYTFAVGATGDLTIDKAPLTITAANKSKTYDGSAYTAFTVTYSGFVNGESSSVLGGTLEFSGSAVGATNAGSYTITPGGLTASNYDIDFVDGTLTIDKAPLTVTADNKSMYFGDPLPQLTVSYNGFVNGETAVVLGGSLSFSGAGASAGPTTPVGTYTITPGGLTAANYDIDFVGGTLTIMAWRLSGFYQPVDMGGVLNSVKAGSTVPLKFEIFKGSQEITVTSAVANFTHGIVACAGGVEDAVEITTTGGTTLRYDTTAGQFVQNWQTPKTAGLCYRVVMTTQDGSKLDALFRLK